MAKTPLHQDEMHFSGKTVVAWVVYGMFLLGAIVLRWVVATEPLWLDELHTAWVVNEGFADVAKRAQAGNQPPLFFWLVWPLVNSLGASVLSLRLLSLILGTALLIGASGLVWRMTRSVLAATFLVAVIGLDETFLFYATEARPYVVIQALGLLQICWFWKLLKRFETGTACGWVLVSLALFFSHYTSIWLFFAEFLFWGIAWLWSPLRFGPLHSKKWAFAVLVVGAVSCLAVSHWGELLGRRSYWDTVSSPSQLAWFLAERSIVFLLPAWGLSLTRERTTDMRWLLLVTLWALVPMVAAITVSLLGMAPMALLRYTQVGAVAFPLALCVAIGNFSRSSKIDRRFKLPVVLGLIMAVLAVMVWRQPVVSVPLRYGHCPVTRFEDWEALVSELNQIDIPRPENQKTPVFLFANVLEDQAVHDHLDPDFQDYLKFPLTGIYALDETKFELVVCPTLSDQPFTVEDIRLIHRQRRAFLLIRAVPARVDWIVEHLKMQVPSNTVVDWLEPPNSHVVLVSVGWN